MISLSRKIDKLCSMFERGSHLHKRRCNPETSLSSLLKPFHSELPFFVDKMKEDGSLSLKTIGKCFKLLEMAGRILAKVVAEMDKRTCNWEEKQITSYLKYSTLYMGLLNSVSSCLFHLGEARLRLLKGLSLLKSSPDDALTWLKPITLKHVEEESEDVVEEDGICDGLIEVGWVWFWGCYMALAALSDDSEKWVEKKSKVDLFPAFGLKDYPWEVKEIVEINEAVMELRNEVEEGKCFSDEADNVWKKVEVFGRELESLQKEVDTLFFDVLGVRDRLLESIRRSLDTQP